jgi:opacity protein-like surface antigen
MKVRSWMGGIALMAFCTAGSAFAAVDATRVGRELKYQEGRTEVGVDVRGGVGGFTGNAGDQTEPGALLGVTALAQPWRILGIEAGYEGQRLPIDDVRIGEGEAIWRHNLSLMAKAGPQLLDDKLRPYVGAGVGVSYLNASEDSERLYNNDFIEEVPLAAGVDYRFTPNIFAGARASYRALFGTSFADEATGTGQTSGGLLNFNLSVGGAF